MTTSPAATAPTARSARRVTTSPLNRLSAALAAAAMAALTACSSGPPREPIKVPAVGDLRAAAEFLQDQVEVRDSRPDWIDRPRVDDGVIYGIGIEEGGRDANQDLFLAMENARRSIVIWLEAQMASSNQPGDLLPPLAVDPDRIGLERLAHDTRADRWYALARLEIAPEAKRNAERVAAIETDLATAQGRVSDGSTESDDRVRAALAILFDVERRRKEQALHRVLTGQELPVPAGLEAAALVERADDLLSRHGVRVLVQGGPIPGLQQAVGSAVGEVHLQTDEFGRGLVSVQIVQSDSFGPGNPYLEVDGTVEVAIDGGDARTYSTPFRVVTTGVSADDARYRASRQVNAEVARIVRETLRNMARVDG